MTLSRYYTPELNNGKADAGVYCKDVISTRVGVHNTASILTITDPLMPPGSYTFKPVGYFGFWPRDMAFSVESARDKYTADEIFTAVEFIRVHQIKNNTTNYTGPYSGAALTFTKGAVPDHIEADGTTHMFGGAPGSYIGDRPAQDDQFAFVLLAWHWCEKRSWDATALAWLTAVTDGETNLAWLEHAWNAVPYDGTTKLIKQWDTNPGSTWGFYDNYLLKGGILPVSVMAHNAALCLAEMRDRLGNTTEATAWVALADDIKTGIQAQFVDMPSWQQSAFLHYYEDFESYPIQAGTPEGWTTVSTGGTMAILADPDDANNKVLRVQDASGSGGGGVQKLFSNANYIGAWDRVRYRSRAAQTNATGVACKAVPAVAIYFGDDGNFKYFNGASFLNLPTTTAYSANTWYEVEARINWGNFTYNVWINGVDKGNVGFAGAGTSVTGIEIVNCGKTAAEVGDYLYDYIALYNSTTDYGTQGYLPDATDEIYGKMPSPAATGYAVWSGILTATQAEKAGRWLKKLSLQPKGSVNGYGNCFQTATYPFSFSHIPYSHHSRHDSKTWVTRFVAPSTSYGQYTDGGYWYYGLNWVLAAIAAADSVLASKMLTTMITTIAGLATGHPYERIDGDTPVNANYITSSTPLYGATDVEPTVAGPTGFANPFGGGFVK